MKKPNNKAAKKEDAPAAPGAKPKESLLHRTIDLAKDLAKPITAVSVVLGFMGAGIVFVLPYISDDIDKFSRGYILRVLSHQSQDEFEKSHADYPKDFLESQNLIALVNDTREIDEMRSLVDTVITFRLYRIFDQDVVDTVYDADNYLLPDLHNEQRIYLEKGMNVTAYFFRQPRKYLGPEDERGRPINASAITNLKFRVGKQEHYNPFSAVDGTAFPLTNFVCAHFQSVNSESGMVPISIGNDGQPHYNEFDFEVVIIVSKSREENQNDACA